MDESFTDFQEKKNICTGPKTKKPTVKKHISKKRIKGQKDIRTLIKPKKNELLTYTKDFNDACAQGGIDVDSEQLQLAIALSKSLQQSDQTETVDIPTKNLTSQERTNRIRRTLQEYGFRIPKSKIKSEPCKRVKKYRKPYKLLEISVEERLQKICNRYSQVLFENPDVSFEKDTNESSTDNKLTHLATNVTYDCIRNNKVYMTEILQEILISKGSLLRDWSNIPGRPVSPKLVEEYVISMPDIQCTQNELDIILSGTLNAAKDIIKSKLNNNLCFDTNVHVTHIPDINIECVENVQPTDDGLDQICEDNLFTMLQEQNRSNSPDIFDDDPSLIGHSECDKDNVKRISIHKTKDNSNGILDLTQTIEFTNKIDTCFQSSNTNERKSNAYIDLTDCVIISNNETSAVEVVHKMEFTRCVNSISRNIDGEIQTNIQRIEDCGSSEHEHPISQDTSAVEISEDELNSDDTIILKEYVDIIQNCDPRVLAEDISKTDDVETMDLTQSSNSNDELPAVNIPGTQKASPDDTIIVPNNAMVTRTNINIKPSNSNEFNSDYKEINEIIVLDVSNDIMPEMNPYEVQKGSYINNSQYTNQIVDFATNNSDVEIITSNVNKEDYHNIDLTQSSDSTIDGHNENSTCDVFERSQINDYNNLGEKGNVSIDHDEIAFQQFMENVCSINEQKKDTQPKLSNSFQSSNNSNSEKISDFELCDRELNYSMCKSRLDNVHYKDNLVINDISNINKTKNKINNHTINRSLSESDLPDVIINDRTDYKDKQFNITLSKSVCSTPIKARVADNKVSVKTPANSEYLVKLGEVTPMPEYQTMSSPERNRELEKYGLKPLKRKRAIQLLTHLYNQTHPVIEQCSEDVPFKKHKPNSPETINLGKNDIVFDKNNIYSETKSVPDIKNIKCCPDDWVFQKREKAKVHSCAVPLHIAFHNYVSCRRLLREAILRYQPVNIDVIHKDLVSNGYKYNPKDLLKFLDRKCITVKTADINARNNQ